MNDAADPNALIGREAIEALRLILLDEDSNGSSRVAAAKTLLDRFMPKDDVELKRREAEERAAALAEARCLLAEFALAKSRDTRADEPDYMHKPEQRMVDA